MTYIEVDDDVRLHVQDLGAGPAVVLVSGFGLDYQLWDRQVRVLAEHGHRVVCVSQRGHGLSDRPLHGYDIDRLAADLVTALEQLGVRDATLVGHSFGGQVAFRASAIAPQFVSKLVLVGSNAVRASRSDGFPFGAPRKRCWMRWWPASRTIELPPDTRRFCRASVAIRIPGWWTGLSDAPCECPHGRRSRVIAEC